MESIFWAVVGIFVIIILLSGVRIVRPTHRGLIERMGKYNRFANPGFHWIIPGIDRLVKINITEQMAESGQREMITQDNLNATVDAQIYFKIRADEPNVKNCQYSVNDVKLQIIALAKTSLRNIVGTLTLTKANTERNTINRGLFETLTKETAAWGVEIVRTELKQISPPKDVQENMNQIVKAGNNKIAAIDNATAAETEADGLKRAAIKNAEGIKEARILEAMGEAEAIRLVNEAAEKYFIGNAQILRKLEAVEKALEHNAKIVVPAGQSLINVIGDLAGISSVAPEKESEKKK